MIILNEPQGTTEWLKMRLWRLTASSMSPIITSTGKLSLSKASYAAIDKLIAGIQLVNVMNKMEKENASCFDEMDDYEFKRFMSHYNGDSFSKTIHTERGHDVEPLVIAALSEKLGTQIKDVGMCVLGDNPNGVVSCSPDGLIYEGGKLVSGSEAKGKSLFKYYGEVRDKQLPDDHKLQIHSSMAICDVDSWHYGSIFVGQPLFHIEVKREKLTDTLSESFDQFTELYAEQLANLNVELKSLQPLGKEAA